MGIGLHMLNNFVYCVRSPRATGNSGVSQKTTGFQNLSESSSVARARPPHSAGGRLKGGSPVVTPIRSFPLCPADPARVLVELLESRLLQEILNGFLVEVHDLDDEVRRLGRGDLDS